MHASREHSETGVRSGKREGVRRRLLLQGGGGEVNGNTGHRRKGREGRRRKGWSDCGRSFRRRRRGRREGEGEGEGEGGGGRQGQEGQEAEEDILREAAQEEEEGMRN